MKCVERAATIMLVASITGSALAHPGHGETGLHGGFLHAWIGWEPALALLVAVVLAWRWFRRR
ncbi:MAG: hypothetical protein VYC42_03395 [Pseudomonadota bacterium]|nr:hypothetical protein [Pseudomonadota bacterium]